MRLTHSASKTRPSRRRRYVVSPRLWMVLVTSSVIAHLLLLATLHSMVARVSPPTDDVPIAVDLLSEADLSPPSTQAQTSAQAPPPVQATTSAPANSDAAIPAPPSTNQSDTTIEADPTIERQDDRPKPTSTKNVATPSTQPAPPPTQPAPPTPRPQQTAPTPRSQQTAPAAPATPTASRPSPRPTPSELSGPVRSGWRLPTPPDVRSVEPDGSEQVTPEPLTEQTRVSQNPVPASYSASIRNITLPTGIRDVPENPATLKEGDLTRTFQSNTSGCLLTPDALSSFGQEVVLKIVVDEKGDIYPGSEPTVQKSSANPGYDNLAICVVKTWKFDPAYDTKAGERFYRSSDLEISVSIN